MTTQTMTPLELLKAAEREYEADNDRESARLLAEATRAVFDMLAESRGIAPSDLTRELGKNRKDKFHYVARRGAWENLLDHAETGGMEDYGTVEWLHITQGRFIRETLRELGVDVPPAPAKWRWTYS